MELLVGLITPAVLSIVMYYTAKVKKELAVGIMTGACILLIILFSHAYFIAGKGEMLKESYSWLPILTPAARAIKFTLFIDGISYALVITTLLLFIFSLVYSNGYIEREHPQFYLLMALLLTGLIGVFISANLLAFYVFWEFMLIPSYFIIARWGYRDPAKVAFKFFIFTHAGAVFLIVGIGLIAVLTGGIGLEIFQLKEVYEKILPFWRYIFAFLTFGFAVKMALWPVHLWLPDAHAEAPAPMSSLLSGIIIEAGAYAIFRIALLTVLLGNPMLTASEATEVLVALASLGVFTAFYGGFMALKEVDVKRVIAYSSISHMGYVLIGEAAGAYALFNGITPWGLYGAIFHLTAHAWSKGLWFLVGGSIMHMTHMRDITKLGGLMDKMPLTGIAGVIGMFSIAGAPPLPCFTSEFLIIAGTGSVAYIEHRFLWIAVLTGIATLVSAAYSLRYFWQVFWYKPDTKPVEAKEANYWMVAGMLGLAILVIALGVMPWTIMSLYRLG